MLMELQTNQKLVNSKVHFIPQSQEDSWKTRPVLTSML